MAISTYDDLVKSITTWGHRDDLDTLIPDFIVLAETEMYGNQIEPLKIRDMESIQTALTSTGRFLSLPDGFEYTRSTRLVVNDGGEIRYQSPEQMNRRPDTGKPQFFTVVGNEIEFDRVPDTDYTIEVQIFSKPTPLSTLNQTNSVLTKYPSIYLYGALTQLFIHSMDDQQAQKYNQLFLNAIKGANKNEKKGRYGPAPSLNLDQGMIV